jgi:hypothetical protein
MHKEIPHQVLKECLSLLFDRVSLGQNVLIVFLFALKRYMVQPVKLSYPYY